MNTTIYSTILFFHIACGFTALASGLVAMFADKAGKLHRASGKVYFWAMTFTCLSSFIMCGLKPNPFLFLITILSYFSVVIGLRALNLKQIYTGNIRPVLLDQVIGLSPVALVAAMYFACYTFDISQNGMEYINAGLGVLVVTNGLMWLRSFSKSRDIKQYWMIAHFQGMGGGYLATTTAFLVTNVDFLPPVVVWITPSVVGSLIIAYTTRKYMKKFTFNQKEEAVEKPAI